MAIEITPVPVPVTTSQVVPMDKQEAIAITLDDQNYYAEMNKQADDGISGFTLAFFIFLVALFARGIFKLFLYVGLFLIIWYAVILL